MFSFLLRGKMGDVLAPRPNKSNEIWSYLKTGQYAKAVEEIRLSGPHFPVNTPDATTSLTPLHIASAAGHLELLVELLSQGALVNAVDKDQNNCLHLAALNNHKGAVEVLLRSGADPSVPNNAGLLPVEMSTDRFVRDLFVRDRSSIFSPLVQARSLFSEYLSQRREPSVPIRLEEEFEAVDKTENKNEPEATVPKSTPVNSSFGESVPSVSTAHPNVPFFNPTFAQPAAPATIHETLVNGNNINNSSNTTSSTGLQYTFNFNAQSNRQHSEAATQGQNPLFFSPAMTVPLETPALNQAREQEELQRAVLQAAADTALAWQLSSEEYNRRYELVRQIQDKKSNALRTTLSKEPHLATTRLADMAGLAVDGHTALHLAAQCDNVEALEALQELGSTADGRKVSFWLRDMQGRTPLHIAAMHNSAKAAAWLRRQMKFERQDKYIAHSFKCMSSEHADDAIPMSQNQSKNSGNINSSKESVVVKWSSPTTATVTTTQSSHPMTSSESVDSESAIVWGSDPVGDSAPVDLSGLTPLGCAKLAASKRRAKPMSSEVQSVLFSPGDRSVLPRTPRAGKSPAPRPLRASVSTASLLFASPAPRVAYTTENSVSTDNLLLSTPMLLHTPQTPNYVVTGIPQSVLLSPVPVHATTNLTSTGPPPQQQQPHHQHSQTVNLVYAVAEAQGWTNGMEDRSVCLSPLLPPSAIPPYPHSTTSHHHPSAGNSAPVWENWSLFGVFDGHGGCFSSDFLSRMVPETLLELSRGMQTNNLLQDTPEAIYQLLTETCRLSDACLAAERRMSVTRNPRNNRLMCLDSSGSTGLLLLVTQTHLAVANVGDCRCVLAQRVSAADNSNTSNNAANSDRNTSMAFVAKDLSCDHKPSLPTERARIVAAGCVAAPLPTNNSVWEVSCADFEGNKLRVSRSFGDFCFKQQGTFVAQEDNSDSDLANHWKRQAVTACPEVTIVARDENADSFLLLACDGVWDVLSSQEAVDLVTSLMIKTNSSNDEGMDELRRASNNSNNSSQVTFFNSLQAVDVARVCDALLAECLSRGSRDNMTCWLILFQKTVQNSQTSYSMYGSTSHGSSRSVSPRLPLSNNNYYHNNNNNSTSNSRQHSRQTSPRASIVNSSSGGISNNSSEQPSPYNKTQLVSFVRDPSLWEVDVPQPPAAVLRSARRHSHRCSADTVSSSDESHVTDEVVSTSFQSSSAGMNDVSSVSMSVSVHTPPREGGSSDITNDNQRKGSDSLSHQNFATVQDNQLSFPVPVLLDQGLLSPLCSAPRSYRRAITPTNEQCDVLVADSESNLIYTCDEVFSDTLSNRIERQLHFE